MVPGNDGGHMTTKLTTVTTTSATAPATAPSLPSTTLEARDQQGFTRSVAALAAASALFTPLLRLTESLWAYLPAAAVVVRFVPHVMFAYFLYAAVLVAARRRPGSLLELGAPAAAGLAMGLCMPAYPILAILLVGGLLGAAVPPPSTTTEGRAGVAAAISVACLVGSLVFGALHNIAALGTLLPAMVANGVMGAIFGAYVGVGALPQHLRLTSDPVRHAYEQARRELTGRLLDNAARCWAMYQRILASAQPSIFPGADDYDEFRTNLGDILLNTFDLSRKWQEVETYLARVDRADLERRLGEARDKERSTADDVARAQYGKVAGALARRQADLTKLEQAKERVMSRLDYYYTVLEDLQLSTVRLKSATAQADSVASEALFEQMHDLAKDLEATSSTLDELGATARAETRGLTAD